MHDVIPVLTRKQRLKSLGFLACWWIECFCVFGSAPVEDVPVVLTPEYMRFIIDCYALQDNGERRFNHVFLSRPKGCNKSGLAALIILFEALGPCRFYAWAKGGETFTFLNMTYTYREGEPMGRFINGPDIKCLANAEDQTGNIYNVVKYNCMSGPLAQLIGEGLDPGETRILLPRGGRIVPSTSGAASKDGGKETQLSADETHLFNTPRAKAPYFTLKRNLSKRKLDADPWLLETTTMFRPGEDSIAEGTYVEAHRVLEGRGQIDSKLLFDHRYADISIDDLSDAAKVKRALYESYGSAAKSTDGKDHIILPDGRIVPVGDDGKSEEGYSLNTPGVEPGPSKNGWIDVRGAMADIWDPSTDVGNSMRYYFNTLASASDAWLSDGMVSSHVEFEHMYRSAAGVDLDEAEIWREEISPEDEITLGFDGSLSDDSTALVGCRVRDGLLFLIKLEQKPEGLDGRDWRVDVAAFDRRAREILDEFNVVGFFADVAYWRDVIIGWERDYGDRLKVSPRAHGDPIRFWTNNWRREMMQILVDVHTAFMKDWVPCDDDDDPNIGGIALMGDPRLVAHFRNARRKDLKSGGYLIYKETPNSPQKIDACMAGLLAYAARIRYLESGQVDDYYAPVRLY